MMSDAPDLLAYLIEAVADGDKQSRVDINRLFVNNVLDGITPDARLLEYMAGSIADTLGGKDARGLFPKDTQAAAGEKLQRYFDAAVAIERRPTGESEEAAAARIAEQMGLNENTVTTYHQQFRAAAKTRAEYLRLRKADGDRERLRCIAINSAK